MQIKNDKDLKAILLLEDGSFFIGSPFGFPRKVIGEVVFNTGMVGYNESLTDPSYKGQILNFTYPLIGNYGVPSNIKDKWGIPLFFESEKIQVSGLVVSELCKYPSHPTSVRSLHDWMLEEGIPGIEGIDTRELTKRLRDKGVMMGLLDFYYDKHDIDELLSELKSSNKYDEINYANQIELSEPIVYENEGPTIALIDCGVKNNIIRNLLKREFKVIRFPHNVNVEKVLEYDPKGVVLSNGPGNPKKFNETIILINDLIEYNLPLLGICLGNQLVAISLGGDTFKMKYGHRGQNKPAIFLGDGLTYVTSQNHGYAVDLNSLNETGLKVWWINADDKTIEGLAHYKKPIITVQFHPEATPGPYDTTFVFDYFVRMIERGRSIYA
jgi:carbamoyl-phosphate synthase small subunit